MQICVFINVSKDFERKFISFVKHCTYTLQQVLEYGYRTVLYVMSIFRIFRILRLTTTMILIIKYNNDNVVKIFINIRWLWVKYILYSFLNKSDLIEI